MTKYEQETYDNLLLMIRHLGKPYVLGWCLGTIIRLSKTDPQLRIQIKNMAKKP